MNRFGWPLGKRKALDKCKSIYHSIYRIQQNITEFNIWQKTGRQMEEVFDFSTIWMFHVSYREMTQRAALTHKDNPQLHPR